MLKAKKIGILVALFIIGLVLIAVSLVIKNSKNKIEKVYTNGVISDIVEKRGSGSNKTSYKVYVSYYAEGKEYTSELNYYNSFEHVKGKTIRIYYDKNNVTSIGTESGDSTLIIVLASLGSVLLAIGIVVSIVFITKRNKNNRIIKNGELINAKYVKSIVDSKNSFLMKLRLYAIVCEWINPEDGKKYSFKSNPIEVNPEPIIKEKGIIDIPIYVDMNNKSQYIFKLDEIIKK